MTLTDVLTRFGCSLSPEQVAANGLGHKICPSGLTIYSTRWTVLLGFHVLDDLRVEVLNLYVLFKRLQAEFDSLEYVPVTKYRNCKQFAG